MRFAVRAAEAKDEFGIETIGCGAWTFEPEIHTDGSFRLNSIGLDLTVSDVYRGTHLG